MKRLQNEEEKLKIGGLGRGWGGGTDKDPFSAPQSQKDPGKYLGPGLRLLRGARGKKNGIWGVFGLKKNPF